MNAIIEYLNGTIEFQNFGFNWMTVSATVAIVFTIIQAMSLKKQIVRVVNNKNGKSISTKWHAYATMNLASVVYYSFTINSLAILITGLRTFEHAGILLSASMYKKTTTLEKVLPIIFLSIPTMMIFSSHKEWVFLVSHLANCCAILSQAWEIYKNKNSGCVEKNLLITYMIPCIFWIIYGFCIDKWAVWVVSGLSFISLGITLLVWYKFNKGEING